MLLAATGLPNLDGGLGAATVFATLTALIGLDEGLGHGSTNSLDERSKGPVRLQS